ncbi:MAG: trehalase family glycosidase [Chthonomonadales bacterium]
MATRLDPLEYLERSDKWYLGGGRGAMFAPAFPRNLDSFGFWDESYFVDIRLERLFTVLMLGEDERPLTIKRDGRRWTPDALTQTHSTPDGLRIREDKVITPNDTLTSRITIYNDGKKHRSLHLILWSLQDVAMPRAGENVARVTEAARAGDFFSFTHSVNYGDSPYADRPAENGGWGERNSKADAARDKTHSLYISLGGNASPTSSCLKVAQKTDPSPDWAVSIVPELFQDGRLTGSPKAELQGDSPEGHLHLCLHYTLEVPVGETRTIQFGAALNLDKNRALLHLQNDLQQDAAAVSRANWQNWFAGAPYFTCSDPHLQKYYWYRWYGIRLLQVNLGGHQIPGEEGVRFPFPCVFEGIGGFRSHVSYSAQCHMLEASWRKDPSLAFGCLEGLFAAQENSGYLPGHLYLWRHTRGFYHANWGKGALQIFHITGDMSWIDRVYPDLARYAEYFERDRDREDSHLFDIVDQGETGQEYMSRYLAADAAADEWGQFRLKGVDATCYIYELQRALVEMAEALGKVEEAAVWKRKSGETRTAMLAKMWDPEEEFFFDFVPDTGKRSDVKAAVGFYPFMSDAAGADQLDAIKKHLLNLEEFATKFPVPASSLDDPNFSSEGEWKGRRMSCPWNGRSWPMSTSHVADALAQAALHLDSDLKAEAADLIHRFVKMLFFDGDPERPNSFEHYNPLTGAPSMYRGIDDYQHSFVLDLMMRYLIGIQPTGANELVLDPLPFDVQSFEIEDIRYRGHSVNVKWDASEGYAITLDGAEVSRTRARERVVIPLG